VARGGGSLEDLAPFNTEKIVRGIYNSKLPVISAVGHETDFTLCDFASDLRVPTPSVAAEMAVFDYYEQLENINQTNKNIYYFITKKIEDDKKNLLGLENFISSNLTVKVVRAKTDITLKIKEIERMVNDRVYADKNRLENMISMISKLSPLEVLKRGFAVVETNGKRATSVKDLNENEDVILRFDDGRAVAQIKNISEEK
jgi:exodeoxyribonuclease VII large subunit